MLNFCQCHVGWNGSLNVRPGLELQQTSGDFQALQYVKKKKRDIVSGGGLPARCVRFS